MVIFVALAGLCTSLFIPSAPSSEPDLKINMLIWRATYDLLKQAIAHKGIFLATLVISWFWLIGVVITIKLPDYTHYVLGADTSVFALFLALFSIGIALGSVMVNVFLHGQINLAIVPWAMLGFTIFSFDLYLASPNSPTGDVLLTIHTYFTHFFHWRIAIDLLMLAFFSGLFVVPLYTYLEVTSPLAKRARTIATNNIYNSLFMVLGAVMVMVFLSFNTSIPQVFLIICLLNIIATWLTRIYLKRVM